MLEHVQPENLICIDIETVPGYPDFDAVPEVLRELFLKKSERLKQEGENEEEQFFNHAGIYAEFGKVVCISIGLFRRENKEWQFRIKSFYGDDEKVLLTQFVVVMNKHFANENQFQFCGHNIKEFDIPYLSRRMLIQGIKLPALLDISGKKPWEVQSVDTMQLWRFGDFKHFTSLKLLAALFEIESPKDDMDGKDVGRVYWKEKNLERIVTYCQKDVLTVVQLILRFKGMPLLAKEQVVISG